MPPDLGFSPIFIRCLKSWAKAQKRAIAVIPRLKPGAIQSPCRLKPGGSRSSFRLSQGAMQSPSGLSLWWRSIPGFELSPFPQLRFGLKPIQNLTFNPLAKAGGNSCPPSKSIKFWLSSKVCIFTESNPPYCLYHAQRQPLRSYFFLIPLNRLLVVAFFQKRTPQVRSISSILAADFK